MKNMLVRSLLLFCAANGCGPTSAGTGGSSGSGTGGDSGTGGTGGSDETGGVGGSSGSGGVGGVDSNPDASNCGVEDFMLQRAAAPDILIVLDRSTSMLENAGSTTKWSQVKGALNQTLMTTQGQVDWGLEFFPDDQGLFATCDVNEVQVPVAENNGTAITMAINRAAPNGGTPTAQAITRAKEYLTGLNDSRSKYILLATDGEPGCDLTDFNAIQDALDAVSSAASTDIHTFVIGISTDSTTNMILNQMAQNGMTARPGATRYYPGNSQADLAAAVSAIAGQVVSCTFELSKVPPYPDHVDVTADGSAVPHDTSHMNGWDFNAGMMSIELYGSVCEQLQSGMIRDVHTTFGCPPIGAPVAPPSPSL